MKLVFADNKNAFKVIAEGNDIMELISALEQHRKSMFVYGGTITLPEKIESGSRYTLASDKEKGMTYFLLSD